MRYVDEFPNDIREIENTWIAMPDGVRLAARIWLPEDAEHRPVPAILEYIPYRKRDWSAARDEMIHKYYAGHGYAGVRVDIRGSGDSEGVLTDEYLERELADGERIIEWLTRQPWCDGNVGMIGISWGGFNGLQIAARRPPALKAVVSVCSTDDRYADDVHYMGGCLLGENLSWASTMFAYLASPPDPAIVGESWREMWFDRLERSGLWLENWLHHQHRDAFWKHGSICENFDDVDVPVMLAGGWADGYTNAIFRMLEHLRVPRLGLVGPWSHKYPFVGKPGPAVGFLQETLRWWGRWLKGEDTGVMDEPMLRAFVQDSMPPHTTADKDRDGRWVGEASWPSPRVHDRRYVLSADHRLVPETRDRADGDAEKPKPDAGLNGPPVHGARSVRSPLSVGLLAGKWCSYAAAPDLPGDQREADGGSLVFQTRPLEQAVELFGSAVVELELSCDQPVAMLAARLSDVRESHEATRVTYGLLNLTHRDSHETPEPLEPGRTYRIRLELNDMAWRFPAGHQIRLSLSTGYWPLAWPSPEAAEATVECGRSVLLLPSRELGPDDDDGCGMSRFAEPEAARPEPRTMRAMPEHSWTVTRDLGADTATLRVIEDRGAVHLDKLGWTVASRSEETYSFTGDDHDSVIGTTHWQRTFARDGRELRTVNSTTLTSDAERFYIHADVDAYEGRRRVFTKSWDRAIPRALV